MTKTILVRRRRIGHCDLPFDLAQGGESFDSAQDREPVERPVEPFGICYLLFGIFIYSRKDLALAMWSSSYSRYPDFFGTLRLPTFSTIFS